MDNQDLHTINEILRSVPGLTLNREVVSFSQEGCAGSFELDTAKGKLEFMVMVSHNFPLGSISFYCMNVRGYNHEMQDGLLCLRTAPAVTIEDRMALELDKLLTWVDKYYVQEQPDPHFDYYSFLNVENIDIVFEEDAGKPKTKGNKGIFTYGELSKKGDTKTWAALDAGGRGCRWSENFKKLVRGRYNGLWVYSATPPVVQRRQTIEFWKDLLPLLDNAQTSFIHAEAKKLGTLSGFKEGFLLLFGYPIPNDGSTEIHWECIFMPYGEFPFVPKKVAPGIYMAEATDAKVGWCRTSNASYERLFGRGKLSDSLTLSKVLIIGTGAIGSLLFHTLVRGGCLNIDIKDGDNVEPGNICRGQFLVTGSFFPKVLELAMDAVNISPYVNIDISTQNIPAISKTNPTYPALVADLMQYDYIFDCSTDKYLSIMLDRMNLRAQVINLSISNEANHLAVITGKGNIHLIKHSLFERISPGASPPFYVATGCWHPTFKASYTDIGVLVMQALNEMNRKLENGDDILSFCIHKGIAANGSLEYKIDYHV